MTERNLEKMYVASYDISDDRLRNKVSKILEGYGRRVQYSVFECRLTDRKYQELYDKLARAVCNMSDGSIRFYYVCANCEAKVRTIGVEDDAADMLRDSFIIV